MNTDKNRPKFDKYSDYDNLMNNVVNQHEEEKLNEEYEEKRRKEKEQEEKKLRLEHVKIFEEIWKKYNFLKSFMSVSIFLEKIALIWTIIFFPLSILSMVMLSIEEFKETGVLKIIFNIIIGIPFTWIIMGVLPAVIVTMIIKFLLINLIYKDDFNKMYINSNYDGRFKSSGYRYISKLSICMTPYAHIMFFCRIFKTKKFGNIVLSNDKTGYVFYDKNKPNLGMLTELEIADEDIYLSQEYDGYLFLGKMFGRYCYLRLIHLS